MKVWTCPQPPKCENTLGTVSLRVGWQFEISGFPATEGGKDANSKR